MQAEVRAKRQAAIAPSVRSQVGISLGALTRARAAAHKAVPAANAGTLPLGPAAVPESRTSSPMANTRKPPATTSSPARTYLSASRLLAITRPTLSMAHNDACRWGDFTSVPASPNPAPTRRHEAAIRSRACSEVETSTGAPGLAPVDLVDDEPGGPPVAQH